MNIGKKNIPTKITITQTKIPNRVKNPLRPKCT
jgi:hypothetical protein